VDGFPYQLITIGVLVLLAFLIAMQSLHNIGPSQVGLVTKLFGRRLLEGRLIAEQGEAGYQPDLLMPGWRFKLWPIFKVRRYDWVQIPPGAIGVVIAQVGEPLDVGAKSAVYKNELRDFSSLHEFLSNGGQRGVQRPVLPPGTTLPMHPIAFLVVTRGQTFGETISEGTAEIIQALKDSALGVVQITPQEGRDVIGVVTILDGPPLPSGDIAGRIGGFQDVSELENVPAEPSEVIQLLLGSKNMQHNNYQDFQAFLDNGGCIGLQHDPLLYGSYLLNPFLVKVEIVPMLVVQQGQVAVIKSYVGLPTEDTSGEEFKFGSIVKPGHRGIWSEPLRTGKYTLNPRIYEAEVVPTSILTLNWSEATSEAHNLDSRLSPIDAKSKEAFDFSIDLQVQIHVPDTKAPKVISMVGTMQNLVNEVLQSAVGNYFRNALQKLGATEFIEQRDQVQEAAQAYIHGYLSNYDVETRGVYIQDVVFPPTLVKVLTDRELATQEKETFANQQEAQAARVNLEQTRGVAESQNALAQARVSVDINKARADAAVAEAEGVAQVIVKTGNAEGTKITAVGAANASAAKALGLANAEAFQAQQQAIGREQTALVALMREIAAGEVKITPDILVGEGGNALGGLLTLLVTQMVAQNAKGTQAVEPGTLPPEGEK
jgi:uncharacterized membrane protein YqiK